MSEYGNQAANQGLWLGAFSRGAFAAVFAVLCTGSVLAQTADVVTFDVDPTGPTHPISPLIYGINTFETSGLLSEKFLYRRLGGNRTSGYNWENNASNAGADWHHQNDDYLSKSNEPAAAVLDPARITLAKGGYVLVTIPMADRVAADKLFGGDIAQTPGFAEKRLLANKPRCAAPCPVEPDRNDRAVYQSQFVAYLKAKLPSAFQSNPSRVFFSLDNEADLWPNTHPRLQGSAADKADPITYDDYFKRSEAYAAAVKEVIPTTRVFGPASYGWAGMRNFQDANPKRDFLDSYLAYMHDAEIRTGRRLLDVLDVHWYPSDQVGDKDIRGNDGSPAIATARVNAPRSLWDRSFVEPSWIGKWNGAVALIPRLKNEIAKYYPDTALSISEYNYGGAADVSGGIAEADVLGIFGREGVFAANIWPSESIWSYIYGGVAMFRDYDGNGGRFGDVSINAVSGDPATTSIYASRDSSGSGTMVLVLINKKETPITASIRVGGDKAYSAAHLYALTSQSSHPEGRGQINPVGKNKFDVPLPQRSVVTLVFN